MLDDNDDEGLRFLRLRRKAAKLAGSRDERHVQVAWSTPEHATAVAWTYIGRGQRVRGVGSRPVDAVADLTAVLVANPRRPKPRTDG